MRLVSAVGGGKISREIDLEPFARDIQADRVQYDPLKYHGIILRFGEDKPAVMIYTSGSFSVSGAKSIDSLYRNFNMIEKEFKRLFDDYSYKISFEVRNLVHQDQMFEDDEDASLNLNALAIGLGLDHIEYEPEQFPGMMYRPNDDNELFLIFASGKVLSTGFQTIERTEEVMETVKNEIRDVLEIVRQ